MRPAVRYYNVGTGSYELPVRDTLADFAMAMEEKLKKKDSKTHWRQQPIEALKRLLLLEVEEFKVAHEFFGADEAMDELRDIANYAMILWDRIRIEKEKQQVSPEQNRAWSHGE